MGKFIDLAGQKFDKLTVIERDFEYNKEHNIKTNAIYWKCVCECGNEKSIRGASLKNGTIRSCGCLKNEDLTGQKFNRLLVIELLPERSKNRQKFYKCLCDCGNYINVRSSDLKTGNTKSCGCFNKELAHSRAIDLTGQIFGRVTVLERGYSGENGVLYWKCQCQCGSIVDVPSRNLRENKTISCGCVRSKGEEKISIWLSSHNIPFEKEKTFKNFKYEETGGAPRYDFYIPEPYNFLIEFNGVQHYEPIGGWNNKESFEKRVERDNIKRDWAKNNNIPLHEISYLEIDNIDKILQEIFGVE